MADPTDKYSGDHDTGDEPSYIEVKLGGILHKIPRGDMSDEEWANTQQKAKEKGILHFTHSYEAPPTPEEAATKEWVRKTVDTGPAPAAQPQKRPANDESGDVGVEPAAPAPKQSAGLYDRIRKTVAQALSQALPDGGLPAEQTPADALKGASNDSAAVALDKKLAPSPASNAEVVAQNQNFDETPPPAAPPPPRPASNAAAIANPDAYPSQPNQDLGPAGQASAPMGASMNPAGAVANQLAQGVATGIQNNTPLGLLMSPNPAAQLPPAQAPVAPWQPPPTGAEQPAGPKELPVPWAKGEPDMTGKVEAAGQEAADAQLNIAKSQAATLKQVADLQTQAYADSLKQHSDMLASKARIDASRQQMEDAVHKTMAELTAPAKVDPDHYFKTNPGARVLAAFAGFLTRGASDSALREAIKMDVQAQQANIDNKLAYTKNKLTSQLSAVQMFRDSGLDTVEAGKAAEAYTWSMVGKKAEALANSGMAGEAVDRANALAALARQKTAELISSMNDHRTKNDIDREEAILRYNAAMQKGGAKGEKPFGDTQLETIGSLEAAIKDLGKYDGVFASKWAPIMNTLKRLLPNAWTDAGTYQANKQLLVRLMAPALSKGERVSEPMIQHLSEIVPDANDPAGPQKWKALTDTLQTALTEKKKALLKGRVPGAFRKEQENEGPLESEQEVGEE